MQQEWDDMRRQRDAAQAELVSTITRLQVSEAQAGHMASLKADSEANAAAATLRMQLLSRQNLDSVRLLEGDAASMRERLEQELRLALERHTLVEAASELKTLELTSALAKSAGLQHQAEVEVAYQRKALASAGLKLLKSEKEQGEAAAHHGMEISAVRAELLTAQTASKAAATTASERSKQHDTRHAEEVRNLQALVTGSKRDKEAMEGQLEESHKQLLSAQAQTHAVRQQLADAQGQPTAAGAVQSAAPAREHLAPARAPQRAARPTVPVEVYVIE